MRLQLCMRRRHNRSYKAMSLRLGPTQGSSTFVRWIYTVTHKIIVVLEAAVLLHNSLSHKPLIISAFQLVWHGQVLLLQVLPKADKV